MTGVQTCALPILAFSVTNVTEETVLSSLNGLGTLVENQLTMDVTVYFWALKSIYFIGLCVCPYDSSSVLITGAL